MQALRAFPLFAGRQCPAARRRPRRLPRIKRIRARCSREPCAVGCAFGVFHCRFGTRKIVENSHHRGQAEPGATALDIVAGKSAVEREARQSNLQSGSQSDPVNSDGAG
ncbi:MAG TPA: hypothetical protein VMG60_16155 [Burkholderiaceae bacterium]|nr:hypothetical protein [Burkholderiaceae bacterium]